LFRQSHNLLQTQMDENTGTEKQIKPVYGLILHLHPRKVKSSTLRFTLTFGLGGMAALLVVMQVFTGLLLKFHYEPSPENAYNSILNLQESLLFGKMLRNLHHWSAIILLWVVFLHTLRVLFTGAFRKPRHITWIFGLALLVLVVLSNFTGYLLPWDQLSFWAVTISTSLLAYVPLIGNFIRVSLLGGQEVGQATLTNFFNMHTGIIPLLMVILMGYHFWRIRKAGGVVVAEKDKDGPVVNTQPHLVNREFVTALVLLAFLFLVSSVFDAPLRERANPSFSPNPAKAPWYFMGLQELLIHFHPFFAVVIFPLSLLVAGCWLPYIPLNDTNQGIWFLSDKGKESGKMALLTGFTSTVFFILLSEYLPDPEILLPFIPSMITRGFIPVAIVIGTLYYFLRLNQRKYALNRSEYLQSAMIILIISYSILTLTGIFFRGEGMTLMWPWKI
jgi:quinol-cytochrome oxidoreductase complex cytochrome b subunit